MKKDCESKQKYEDPAYNLDQIISTLDKTKRDTEAIFNLPPPKREPEPTAAATDSADKK